jgi:hypothetical protein
MSKLPKADKDIQAILEDYHLFLDCNKSAPMPFMVDKIDVNHVTSLKGECPLSSDVPLGNTVLECEVREKNEYNYSFKVLTDSVKSRMLIRFDEGNGVHRNSHLSIPVDQQQVPTPHFHQYGDDGILYAFKTEELNEITSPINIHEGFSIFCNHIHIMDDSIEVQVHEEGTLPLVHEPDSDPLDGIVFP